jgi:hypothetical protein
MSYTVSTPGAKPRPGTVTLASALLYLCGAIQLISIIPAFMAIAPVRSVIEEEFAGDPNADTALTATTIAIVIGVIFAVVIGVGAIVLGALIRRGKNPARIVTWVVAGIGVLCMGCGLAGSALQDSLTSVGAANAESAEIQQRILDATPGWTTVWENVTNVIVLVALVAVIILLAVPASNEFFRKEQEVWVPPTDPGQPPYPPAPLTP